MSSSISNFPSEPKIKAASRIVSLVPSKTELLFDLGLDNEVVGITKFCVHPAKWFRTKTRIGGTKTVDIEKVKNLVPDLIIANKEENVRDQVEELSTIAPVYTSDIKDLTEALQMISEVGRLVGREETAIEMVEKIQSGFKELYTFSKASSSSAYRKAAYLIWKEPYMTVGGDTFIDSMLQLCGFQNVFHKLTRYPEVTVAQIKDAGCDLLLLSSEPYPFKQKHVDALQLQLPQTKIILVDGEMFSWYGSRLIKAASYFQDLIKETSG